MLILKNNPAGVDIPIQKAQTKLHSFLTNAWEIDEGQYECYGRAYRNQSEGGYVAEVYIGGNEYKEVYFNDGLHAISFFGISTEVTNSVMNRVNVHLVMFADLNKMALKDRFGATIQHRADEELRQQVFRSLSKFSFGMNYEGFELGVENVLKEYPGTRRDDRLKFIDMHPYHCFRFNYNLIFDPNKIC
ncbi:MAG: hypothetical protein KF862_07220 [Chitinophagaceae bacterium]|nr:hypothetical protein [Chitinophagaceae bacterium]